MPDQPFTILVVDDEPVNVLRLQIILEKQGYEVLTAANGPEGRELARSRIPDLVLLDIMMPGEDGFVTCEKLKQDPVTAAVPVVFISALDDVDSKVKGLDIGGWDYIAKPFQSEEVLARVRNYLKRKSAGRQIIKEQSQRLRQIKDAQQALLVKPDEVPEAAFAVHYVPALEAGGDFYDVFAGGPGIFNYFVSDISGHDLGASFATSALKALIRQNSPSFSTPDEIMQGLNRALVDIFSHGQHLTAVLGRLDRGRSRLTIVNGAHPPVIWLPVTGEIKRIEANSDVMGVFGNGLFACLDLEVRTGDRFFLYTDGLIESFVNEPRSREKGLAALMECCARTRGVPLPEVAGRIAREMFPEGREPEDDVLLLVLDV